jgi:hypothetical protein
MPWSMCAIDVHADPVRQFTASGLTELEVLREMATALRAIGEGKLPQ